VSEPVVNNGLDEPNSKTEARRLQALTLAVEYFKHDRVVPAGQLTFTVELFEHYLRTGEWSAPQ
jgi:hypothetical protein